MDLKDKVALIPGAIRGIGLEIAKLLGAQGVRLILPYYDWLDDLKNMHESLDSLGIEYISLPADLRYEDQVKKVIKEGIDRFERLDILINNIERGGWPLVHGPYVPKQWQLEFETTVNAKWYLFNNCLPHLKEHKESVVINVTSISAEVGRSGPCSLIFNDCYSLSNRGVSLLTKTWARQGAPEVRVNELMLGIIETRHGPHTRGWSLLTEDQKHKLLDHTLLARTGKVEEVAKAVLFLVKDATFMTGAQIVMDGGYLLGADKVYPMPEGVVSPDEPTFGGSSPPSV